MALGPQRCQSEPADGDRLGVVGRNGSGKSTLCRVLAGYSNPLKVRSLGTVVPLLGFGAALPRTFGCSECEAYGNMMDAQPVILTGFRMRWFGKPNSAGCRPVSHYSTGMRARLAFIVATSISADVLLVDEALGWRHCFPKASDGLTMFMQKAKSW